jgi:hypothetical protein
MARSKTETAGVEKKTPVEEIKADVENVVEAVEAKVEEVKEAIVSAEEESAPAAEEKPERKRPGRKPGSKNKAAKEDKDAKKELTSPEVFIQFGAGESSVQAVVEKIRAEYVAQRHRASAIKSLKVYLKPEDNAAYYVINEKVAGKVDLF